MNLNNISFNSFKEIQTRGYTLDMVYLLSLFKDNIDVRSMSSSARINEIIALLIRKGLLTEEDVLTIPGKELLSFIEDNNEDESLPKKNKDTIDFDRWWSAYPSTNTFSYRGKDFPGERALKVKKDDCRLKINKILQEGEYNIDLLISALNLEVYQKKESSIREGKNKMTYMHNSLTYLNQRDFEPFIDLIKEGKVIKEETQKTFDGINI
jgi:hypothetical protein